MVNVCDSFHISLDTYDLCFTTNMMLSVFIKLARLIRSGLKKKLHMNLNILAILVSNGCFYFFTGHINNVCKCVYFHVLFFIMTIIKSNKHIIITVWVK